MKVIELTQYKFALVDAADYDALSAVKWRANTQPHTTYAVRESEGRTVQMHRVITAAPQGVEVDHINGDGLDNRRDNLRLCSRKENQRNKRVTPHSSKYKGVTWNTSHGKWQARIRIDGRQKHLGYFTDEIDAGRAYDEAAVKAFGEFARLNEFHKEQTP